MSESELEYDYSDYSDYYNDSDGYSGMCSHEKNLSTVLVLAPYVHSIICVLSLLGNTLVIVTYACYKRTRSMTDVYLLNVAVADLLFALTLPVFVGSQLWSWPLGTVGCKLLRGSYSVNLYAGMLLLACVSVDRYIAIVQARRSFRLRSTASSRIICVVVWACALLLSVPTFCFYSWYLPSHLSDFVMVAASGDNTIDTTMDFVCEYKFSDANMATKMKVAVPSTQMAVGFLLPLFIMMCCYTAVIVTLTKAKNFQRHKAVRVVLLVVVVFVVCNLPYNVALLYDTAGLFREQSCKESDARETALSVTQTLAYLRCCLNPLLYAFVGVKFRNHFRKMFQDLFCRGRRLPTRRNSSWATSEVFVSSVRRSVDSSSDGSSFIM